MIGKLRGKVDSVRDDALILDVSGVGYLVFCSGKTLNNLVSQKDEVSLLIETHVREDHIHLFGFQSASEQWWFNALTTVKGVGARIALGILSVLSADDIVRAVSAQDKAAFSRVSGIGPKLAERLVIELKSHVKSFADGTLTTVGSAAIPDQSNAGIIAEAASALSNLGFNKTEAYGIVARLHAANTDQDLQTLIRLGLKELSA